MHKAGGTRRKRNRGQKEMSSQWKNAAFTNYLGCNFSFLIWIGWSDHTFGTGDWLSGIVNLSSTASTTCNQSKQQGRARGISFVWWCSFNLVVRWVNSYIVRLSSFDSRFEMNIQQNSRGNSLRNQDELEDDETGIDQCWTLKYLILGHCKADWFEFCK